MMGQITDRQILDTVKVLGTATSSMIYDRLWNASKLTRNAVARITGPKLKMLVKYRHLEVMLFQDKPWYYLPDTVPEEEPKEPPTCGADRLRAHIDSMNVGSTITIGKAMQITSKGHAHTHHILMRAHLSHKDRSKVYRKVRV